MRDRTYPFARTVYAYLNRDKDKPTDPDEAAFLAFILSREGQDIAEQGGYLARCPSRNHDALEIKPQPFVAVPGPTPAPVPCGR